MTSKKHKRCLDRVFEAARKNYKKISDKDIVVCIQGDEPMLHPDMIKSVIKQLKRNDKIKATVLTMDITDVNQFKSPNIVKVVNNKNGEILYCSRSPIPNCKKFSKKIGAKRIYGIFAFKYYFLKHFFSLKSSIHEIIESCDQNRICDNGGGMFIAPYKYIPSFSIDTLSDLRLVRKKILRDKLWSKY